MPLPTIEISYLNQIYSPFSGLPAETDDSANEADSTLLFIYYGNASIWDYVSPRLTPGLVEDQDELELDPFDLAKILEAQGGLVMVVDTDWNGVNYYGFAPADSEIRVSPT